MECILPSYKNVKVSMPTHSLKEVGVTFTFKRREGILHSLRDLGMPSPLKEVEEDTPTYAYIYFFFLSIYVYIVPAYTIIGIKDLHGGMSVSFKNVEVRIPIITCLL